MRITDRTLHREANPERGSALLLATFLTSSLAVLTYALVTMVSASSKAGGGLREDMNLLYVCEGALNQAVFSMEQGGDGNIGAEGQQLAYGNASFFVTATDLGSGVTALSASSSENGSLARMELTVQENADGFFDWAAFGDEGLVCDSNAQVDSYDSTAGSYEDQEVNGNGSSSYANSNGDLGSNADVLLKSNTKTWGDAVPGPGGTATVSGNATLSGSSTPNTALVAMPAITVPSFPQTGDYIVNGNGTGVIGAGNHHFSTFELGSNSSLVITGPATIVVDDFELKSNAELKVDDSNGGVEFFVMNDFLLNSNTTVASTSLSPASISFNLLSNNVVDPTQEVDLDYLTFESNAVLFGTIYAPHAYVDINSNFELFGSVIARSVLLDSNAKIHFDESLMTGGGGSVKTFTALCWRPLSDMEYDSGQGQGQGY